ncbi:alpha/beta fold hydrolase [Cyanobium sp. T1G-Tous]|uniref:alpha/beta fold hydrolase n=1 Tax=Cyanobium sp. T1G-Tous TaxID=2823722 RepID=UPI0020CE8443|nr:alpha/beta fold hydrolase [Cyanobium sp. T1G-Tous]MCP9803043.1 alpha/beta fold hydrolase [Cyanobium sp. T1G-Tous]
MTNSLPFPHAWGRQWQWRDELVSYVICAAESSPAMTPSEPEAVILVHGFGACKEHWRHNIGPLARHHTIFALDLLGFGASSKPRARLEDEPEESGSCRYGIDLWATQVVAFIASEVKMPVTLVGNSIGGVVALRVAQLLEEAGQPARRVVLVDCAQRAIDDKRLDEQPQLRKFGRPLLKGLIRQRWLTRLLFSQLSQPGVIRRVLGAAYPSGANVDDQLVTALVQPTQLPGADEAFHGFANLFNDRLAPDILENLQTPVHMIWGEMDPWEPVSEARRWSAYSCVQSLEVLPGLGHCPHDEAPERVNPILLKILNQIPE